MASADKHGQAVDFVDPGPGRLSCRERVERALNHQEPDRVPADLWAVPEVKQRLQEHLGVSSWDKVLQKLRIDVRWVAPDYMGPVQIRPGGVTVDPYGAWRRPQQHGFGSYAEYAGYPLADAQTAADIHTWDWPRPEFWDVDSIIRQLDELDAQGQYFVCYEVGGIFERAWALRGFERFLIDLIENPEVPCAIMDHLTDLYIANLVNVLRAANGRIQMVYTYDDIAHQHSLLLSKRMWQKYVVPRHQRMNIAIRAFGVHIMYHSCGAVYPVIGELIRDLGIDVLQSLQPRADGMDMTQIKKEFGARLSFHGGVDIQHTMPHGSPQEVQAEVQERCRILGKGGGYILSTAHYIQNDTPIENIMAFYSTPRTTA